MPLIATCPTCHRRERWEGEAVVVELEGGRRRPVEHPTLQAWRSLRDARQGGRAVVGPCVCGQPLLADGPAAGVVWTLSTPDGPVQVGPTLVGPDGPLDAAEVDALIERHFRRRWEIRPGLALFRGSLLLAMIGPVLLWAFLFGILILFLIEFTNTPGFR